MRVGVLRSLGPISTLLLILFSLAGCHPAQLRMPELQIKPSLTLAVPASSASASGPLKVMGVAFRPGHDQIAAGYSDGRVRALGTSRRGVVIHRLTTGMRFAPSRFPPTGASSRPAGEAILMTRIGLARFASGMSRAARLNSNCADGAGRWMRWRGRAAHGR